MPFRSKCYALIPRCSAVTVIRAAMLLKAARLKDHSSVTDRSGLAIELSGASARRTTRS
jgi:hypothetical protein